MRFVINGGGAALDPLRASAEGLDNVRFVDMQPRERLPEVLAAADIHVVPLKRGLARSSVPSKLYSILAAGRPVVASVDAGHRGRPRPSTRPAPASPCRPTTPRRSREAMTALLDDPERRAELGRSGRAFVEHWVSPAAVGLAYEELFETVARRRSR